MKPGTMLSLTMIIVLLAGAVTVTGCGDKVNGLTSTTATVDQKELEELAKSELRNAALAQESYYTDNETYTTMLSDLTALGWNPEADVTVTINSADAMSFCMEAVHSNGGDTWSFNSNGGLNAGATC